MKPKFKEVLDMAIEDGVARGLRRAWKHRSDGPTEEVLLQIKEQVYEAVMDSLYEWFDLQDEGSWEEED
jgi:hypothetical protein